MVDSKSNCNGNTGTAFAIDAATGVLTVADETAIDYAGTLDTNYTLVISVNDGTGDDVTFQLQSLSQM